MKRNNRLIILAVSKIRNKTIISTQVLVLDKVLKKKKKNDIIYNLYKKQWILYVIL